MELWENEWRDSDRRSAMTEVAVEFKLSQEKVMTEY